MRTHTLREPRRPDPLRKDTSGVPLTNNPRDNLVTLVAVVDGEEAFTDTNGNDTWDDGEAFVDGLEPFVDANDNGTWDADELFLDGNENGRWDGRNGQWDHAAKVWAQERILWTGLPGVDDLLRIVPGLAGHRPTVLVQPERLDLRCPAASITCNQAGVPIGGGFPDTYGPLPVFVYVADPWFNSLARNGASDGCRNLAPESPAVVGVIDLNPPAGRGARELWPAGDEFTFKLRDVRDPSLPPAMQIPKRTPPVSFSRDLACDFTGSLGGATTTLTVPVNGTIE